MRRKFRLVDPAGAVPVVPRRRRDAAVPAVPTFKPDSETVAEAPAEPSDDAAEDAVRRMVEAAYT
jgi:hypothetical protein